MKNKLFWPIIIVAIVIMVESVMLLSNNQLKKSETSKKTTDVTLSEEIKAEDVVEFDWLKEKGKAILTMTANKEVAIDAIDLYIGYTKAKVSAVTNFNELPKPSFSKISTEKSLVVMNYLMAEASGFKMMSGQTVKVAELDLSVNSADVAELFIDAKTQVVENGSAKVLPFNSKKLIISGNL